MEALLDAIRAERGLSAWLKAGLWKRGFDRGSLGRADGYANHEDIRVTDVTIYQEEAVVCEAKVRGSGSAKYLTRVGFFHRKDSWRLEAECSCPVGLFCKHGAAIVLLAIDELDPTPKISAPAKIDPQLRTWLLEMDLAAQVAQANAQKPPAAEKRFLAFCIEHLEFGGKSGWEFGLRVGHRLRDGDFQISDTMAQADPSRPPKYMTREDFIPAALFYQKVRKSGIWNQLRVEGPDWEELLETALGTGRLFILRPRDDQWVAAAAGGPVAVEASWEMLSDGRAKPALVCKDERLQILPTRPLRYLDPESGVVGMLEGELPPPLMAAWVKGPEISADQISNVAATLSRIAPAVPVPSVLETVRSEFLPPRPELKITLAHFHTYLGREEIIHGQFRFRYGESAALSPLANNGSREHVEIHGGKRVIYRRDQATERRMERRLHELGLVTLHQVLPHHGLAPEARRAVIPRDRMPSIRDAWLRILESPGLSSLREDGWTIDIDPRSGLLIHDITDFFPAIEADPDHGIDWFRFDARYVFEGKQLNLIPIIAEAIERGLPHADSPDLPDFLTFQLEDPEQGHVRFPARRLMGMVDQVRHLFHGHSGDGPPRMDRLGAAAVADSLAIDSSETLRALARLGRRLRDIRELPAAQLPAGLQADLRPYQREGYRWLQFLAAHGLHGILADDMGLGKTVQTLAHLAAEREKNPGKPSLVIAPTSVVPNWTAEVEKFTPGLNVLTLQGNDRARSFAGIPAADIVITSYPLVTRDFDIFAKQDWQVLVLDEAQYIKNPKSITARNACHLKAVHRLCLSGTPMENHLGELWSLMRFLMPGFLGDETSFNSNIRRPIERDRSGDAQLALNRRVSPLILRRTKDKVATDLPEKTEMIHHIDLTKKQTDLYESVRASMDKRVRDAIAVQGLARSHIIVLDALLKLRQICCHPQLLKNPAAQKVAESAKLTYLTDELLPTLLEEGRRILLFSTFTSMLALIEEHLEKQKIPFLKLTGKTKERSVLVKKFQTGAIPVFLISLKAGGTGLNLTAADTVIHFDPWWNPAAENQATDRAHRIGQTKPVFVHKLVCRGTIEDRILELQKLKSDLVEALLSEETTKLKIDADTLSHLLSPLETQG